MASASSVHFDPEHPLVGDRQRLDHVIDVMHATIQKTLFRLSRGQHSTSEQLIDGSGVSVDDVLSEALADILRHPPGQLKGEWEALGVRIARNKTVDAYRASRKGLRGTERRDHLRLVSGDAKKDPGDGTRVPLFDLLPTDWDGPEVECEQTEKALLFHALAREVLPERDLRVVFARLDGYSGEEVAEKLGLTGQRVGQIFRGSMAMLATHPDNPFTSGGMQEGGDQ